MSDAGGFRLPGGEVDGPAVPGAGQSAALIEALKLSQQSKHFVADAEKLCTKLVGRETYLPFVYDMETFFESGDFSAVRQASPEFAEELKRRCLLAMVPKNISTAWNLRIRNAKQLATDAAMRSISGSALMYELPTLMRIPALFLNQQLMKPTRAATDTIDDWFLRQSRYYTLCVQAHATVPEVEHIRACISCWPSAYQSALDMAMVSVDGVRVTTWEDYLVSLTTDERVRAQLEGAEYRATQYVKWSSDAKSSGTEVKGEVSKTPSGQSTPSRRGGFKSSTNMRGGAKAPSKSTSVKPGACHVCGEQGHWAPQCPQRAQRTTNTGGSRGGARRVANTGGVERSAPTSALLHAMLGGNTPGGKITRVGRGDVSDYGSSSSELFHDDDLLADLQLDKPGMAEPVAVASDEPMEMVSCDTAAEVACVPDDDVSGGQVSRLEKIDGRHDMPGNYLAIEVLDNTGQYRAQVAVVDTGADMSCIGKVLVKKYGLQVLHLTREEYPAMYSFDKKVDCGCACEVTFRLAGATQDYQTRMMVIQKDEILLGAPFYTFVTGVTPATVVANSAMGGGPGGFPRGQLGGAWPPLSPPGMGPRGMNYLPLPRGLPGHMGAIYGAQTATRPSALPLAAVPGPAATRPSAAPIVIPDTLPTQPAPASAPAATQPTADASSQPAPATRPSAAATTISSSSVSSSAEVSLPAAPSDEGFEQVPDDDTTTVAESHHYAAGDTTNATSATSSTSRQTDATRGRPKPLPRPRSRRRLQRPTEEPVPEVPEVPDVTTSMPPRPEPFGPYQMGPDDEDNDNREITFLRHEREQEIEAWDAEAAEREARWHRGEPDPDPERRASWERFEQRCREQRERMRQASLAGWYPGCGETYQPNAPADPAFLEHPDRSYVYFTHTLTGSMISYDADNHDYVYGARRMLSASNFDDEFETLLPEHGGPTRNAYEESAHDVLNTVHFESIDWFAPVVDARPGEVVGGRLFIGLDHRGTPVFDYLTGRFGPGVGRSLSGRLTRNTRVVGVAWNGTIVGYECSLRNAVPRSGPHRDFRFIPHTRAYLRPSRVMNLSISNVNPYASTRAIQTTRPAQRTSRDSAPEDPARVLADEVLVVPAPDVEESRAAVVAAASAVMPEATQREIAVLADRELVSFTEGAFSSTLLRSLTDARIPTLPSTMTTSLPSTTPAVLALHSSEHIQYGAVSPSSSGERTPVSDSEFQSPIYPPVPLPTTPAVTPILSPVPEPTSVAPAEPLNAPSRLPRPASVTARTARRSTISALPASPSSPRPATTTARTARRQATAAASRPARTPTAPVRYGFETPKSNNGSVHRTTMQRSDIDETVNDTEQFLNITTFGSAAPVLTHIEALPDTSVIADSDIPKDLPLDVQKMWKQLPKSLLPNASNRHPVANLVPIEISVAPEFGNHKMPPAWRAASKFKEAQVQQHLDEYEKLGIVRKVPRTFVKVLHPTFLVPRKGSELMRLIVDFKAFNASIAPFPYPLPIIEDLLNTAANADFITEIDLKLAYFSIPIAESSQAYACIENRGQVYALTRLPMGLGPAPAQFQRIVEAVVYGTTVPSLQGGDTHHAGESSTSKTDSVFQRPILCPPVTEADCTPFFDNIVVHTIGSRRDHLCKVQHVLSRIAEAGFVVSPTKCHIAQKSTTLLGFLVGRRRKLPSPTIAVAFRELSVPPTTHRQCVSAIAALNFVQNLVPCFARVVEPFRKLMEEQRNEKTLTLTSEQREAWRAMVEKVVSNAFIFAVTPGAPMRVTTDWSGDAIAAVLENYREDKHRWEVVGCFAKRCTGAQRTYGSAKGELYAISLALRKWRRFLEGRTFVVRTDSQALLSLGKATACSAFAVRLVESFVGLQFVVEHLPGVSNVLADYLSRCRMEVDESPVLFLKGNQMATLEADVAEKATITPDIVLRPIVTDNSRVDFVVCPCKKTKWMAKGGDTTIEVM